MILSFYILLSFHFRQVTVTGQKVRKVCPIKCRYDAASITNRGKIPTLTTPTLSELLVNYGN